MSVTYLRNTALSKSAGSKFHRGVTRVSVLIADAQVLFSDALASALERYEELAVFDDRPTSGVETLQVAEERQPDVALVDYWLAEMDGPAVARELVSRLPQTKLLHLSWFHGPAQVDASLQAGAVGFLPKSVRVEHVVEGINRAAAGECPVFERELSQLVHTIARRGEYVRDVATRLNTLTSRELEVLRLLAGGLTVSEVAKHLGITVATARRHVHRILTKTKARSQLEAVAMARDQGWQL